MKDPKPDLPAVLYRAFDQRHYALAFVSAGSMRFRLLDVYQRIEDAGRQDEAEGSAKLQVPPPNGPGYISFTRTNLNPTYVLCTSMGTVDLVHLARQYGPHIVRINEPHTLLQDLRTCLKDSPHSQHYYLDAAMVSYTRDAVSHVDPPEEQWFRLAYTQKATSFAADHEFRFALVRVVANPRRDVHDKAPHIDINLGKRLDYCDLLPNNRLQPTSGAPSLGTVRSRAPLRATGG